MKKQLMIFITCITFPFLTGCLLEPTEQEEENTHGSEKSNSKDEQNNSKENNIVEEVPVGPDVRCGYSSTEASAQLLEGGGNQTASVTFYTGGALNQVNGVSCTPLNEAPEGAYPPNNQCTQPYQCGEGCTIWIASGESNGWILKGESECTDVNGFYRLSEQDPQCDGENCSQSNTYTCRADLSDRTACVGFNDVEKKVVCREGVKDLASCKAAFKSRTSSGGGCSYRKTYTNHKVDNTPCP